MLQHTTKDMLYSPVKLNEIYKDMCAALICKLLTILISELL